MSHLPFTLWFSSHLRFRFNLSLQEISDDNEGPDEDGRPCFSAIDKSSGFLDKELAASGFTKKDEDDLERV